MNSIHHSYDAIKKRLESGAWAQGQRLGSLEELGNMFGASRSTLWRVVKRLQKESLLHANRGGAIVAGPVGTARVDELPHGPLWERLKSRLGVDIVTGIYPEPVLPPICKMALTYGAAINTLKKALARLERDGIIQRDGRSYRQVRTPAGSYRSTVVLVSEGDKERGVYATEPRTQVLVESFERECSRLGYRSVCEGFNCRHANGVRDTEGALKEVHRVSGYIVNVWSHWSHDHWQRWLDLLNLLARRGFPVMVIDQSGDCILPEAILRTKTLRILRIAGERAGWDVADFLHRRNHHRIAYITPYYNLGWAQNRYAGLCRYFAQYGGERSKVELFASNEFADPNDLILAFIGLDKKGVGALYHERLSREEIQGLQKALSTLQNGALPRLLGKGVVARDVRKFARYLTGMVGRDHDPATYDQMLQSLLHISSHGALDLYLRPFVENVLRNSAATAWVCSDDNIVATILHMLKAHKKRVPQDIAIVSFNNWRVAHELQLSSFDFNMAGMVQQALLMIGDEKSLRGKPAISVVDGYVVERKTTRR